VIQLFFFKTLKILFSFLILFSPFLLYTARAQHDHTALGSGIRADDVSVKTSTSTSGFQRKQCTEANNAGRMVIQAIQSLKEQIVSSSNRENIQIKRDELSSLINEYDHETCFRQGTDADLANLCLMLQQPSIVGVRKNGKLHAQAQKIEEYLEYTVSGMVFRRPLKDNKFYFLNPTDNRLLGIVQSAQVVGHVDQLLVKPKNPGHLRAVAGQSWQNSQGNQLQHFVETAEVKDPEMGSSQRIRFREASVSPQAERSDFCHSPLANPVTLFRSYLDQYEPTLNSRRYFVRREGHSNMVFEGESESYSTFNTRSRIRAGARTHRIYSTDDARKKALYTLDFPRGWMTDNPGYNIYKGEAGDFVGGLVRTKNFFAKETLQVINNNKSVVGTIVSEPSANPNSDVFILSDNSGRRLVRYERTGGRHGGLANWTVTPLVPEKDIPAEKMIWLLFPRYFDNGVGSKLGVSAQNLHQDNRNNQKMLTM